jgi:hypothetical protein
MMVSEYAACSVLAAWLTLTIAKYVKPRWSPGAFGLGGLQLLHRWVLFSYPPVANGRVFYRTIDRAGNASGWTELSLALRRSWTETFWSPRRRSASAFVRAQRAIWTQCERGADRETVEVSLAFLRILGVVTHAATTTAGASGHYCQFLLTHSAPDRTTRLALRSGLHRLSHQA